METIEINGQTIQLQWDDEADPQNSIGWLASADGQEWTPVGENISEYLPTLDGLSDTERWERILEWQQSTRDGAIADAQDYFGAVEPDNA